MNRPLAIRPFETRDRAALVELWTRCELIRPWNDPERDIERKRTVDPAGLLVGESEGGVVASVMAGYDGHRGWINYLAVDPDHRGRGHAAAMMGAAEELLRDLGCPKINLQVRTANASAIGFYEAIGYVTDEVVSMSRRLVDDT